MYNDKSQFLGFCRNLLKTKLSKHFKTFLIERQMNIWNSIDGHNGENRHGLGRIILHTEPLPIYQDSRVKWHLWECLSSKV